MMKISPMKRIILVAFITAFGLQSCTKDDATNDINTDDGVSANQQQTGTSANDLLSDNVFTSMVVEVAYINGFAPTQEAIDNVISFLESRTYKPNGITVVTNPLPPTGNNSHTIQDIVSMETANRIHYNSDDQIAVWIFFTDGESASNSDDSIVLGTAYRNTSFVIFEETLHSLSDSTFEPDRSLLETTVISHEFGHLLGLTNLGSTMQTPHEDTENAKHCNVESCLMYWAAESGSGLDNLMGSNNAPQLDAQCIADLQANGGK